jgi:RND superfamily putative drug exporter
MYRLLGYFVTRSWVALLAGWLALVWICWHAAPKWEDVAQDKEFAFLPAEVPSRRGEEIFQKAFPDDRLASSVVLVLRSVANTERYREQNKKFIEDILEPGLRKIAEDEGGLAGELAPSDEPLFSSQPQENRPAKPKSIIARIRTPNAPVTGALLVSEDGKAMLVVVELTTEFHSRRNWPTLDKIEELVTRLGQEGKTPPQLDISVTGSAVMGRDHTQAQLQSAKDTERLTILLVVVLLIVIYRSPLLALIPLATVFLATNLSLSVLALLAEKEYVTLFEGIQIYITILSYGAGVDYSIFLTARYKEELDRAADHRDAVAAAIGNVGAALTASASTVMFGIAMMAFAEFGKFRHAGIAIPVSIFVVLCATLTFSPALLRLAGRWAFWPKVLTNSSGRHHGWEQVGKILERFPGTVWVGTVAVMGPFAVAAALSYNFLTYDVIRNLPADAPSVAGTRVLQEHFPAGQIGAVTVLLVNPHVDFAGAQGRSQVELLTNRLREQKEELGLADVRSLALPLGINKSSKIAWEGSGLSDETVRKEFDKLALERYLTDLGERTKTGTRFDFILERDPFARQSIENLERIESAFRAALSSDFRHDSQVYFLGSTASVRDLQSVIKRDRLRNEILVLTSVFVILVLLLRKPLISLYLILSVLLSYLATLGVTFALFWALDPNGFAGIDWKVAVFLFTILIAVGEDYNIFLMARIDEEQRRHGPVRGITEALARTGPIISSCGIIMAGTFASLLKGSLTEMKQLGFALAFGILLDTFVVRPILVPSFLVLLHSGRLRPAFWRRQHRASGA